MRSVQFALHESHGVKNVFVLLEDGRLAYQGRNEYSQFNEDGWTLLPRIPENLFEQTSLQVDLPQFD
jgi:hypothetical protein